MGVAVVLKEIGSGLGLKISPVFQISDEWVFVF
jgi:hypothetical protein